VTYLHRNKQIKPRLTERVTGICVEGQLRGLSRLSEKRWGDIMLRLWLGESTRAGESARAPAFVSDGQRVRYLVTRQEDVWFINFAGEKFGPYISEREAMLFAVDAAQKLGANGEDKEVCRVDEHGDVQPAWSYGLDPYPPRL